MARHRREPELVTTRGPFFVISLRLLASATHAQVGVTKKMLLSLPTDVQLQIFEFSSFFTITALDRVCASLRPTLLSRKHVPVCPVTTIRVLRDTLVLRLYPNTICITHFLHNAPGPNIPEKHRVRMKGASAGPNPFSGSRYSLALYYAWGLLRPLIRQYY